MRPKDDGTKGGGRRTGAGGRPRTAQPRRATIDIRALLADREFIKVTAYVLPRRTKIQVLEMMERLRRPRIHQASAPSPGGAGPLPEMTGGELVREINWRLGTLPPEDAEAVARYIRHLTRWRAARRKARAGPGGPG
ncbi:MAG: hypothetical protein E6H00_01335 [Bacillati bacterium ANGP1]|uniref:Uncharacterized protein n=1 Tax=Candidatus Segetimicrobium genomatis TaxID=2569760 RepID=A0A537KC86_9BACT|nr:MAG: hypothetical protein E6H00_01335 [Terrabacteria group bacterium ANGP1]